MPCDTVDVQAGAQHSAPARHYVIGSRVADHHAIDTGDGRVLEKRLSTAKGTCVLIHVEKQDRTARPAIRGGLQPGEDVREDSGTDLRVRRPAPVQLRSTNGIRRTSWKNLPRRLNSSGLTTPAASGISLPGVEPVRSPTSAFAALTANWPSSGQIGERLAK